MRRARAYEEVRKRKIAKMCLKLILLYNCFAVPFHSRGILFFPIRSGRRKRERTCVHSYGYGGVTASVRGARGFRRELPIT